MSHTHTEAHCKHVRSYVQTRTYPYMCTDKPTERPATSQLHAILGASISFTHTHSGTHKPSFFFFIFLCFVRSLIRLVSSVNTNIIITIHTIRLYTYYYILSCFDFQFLLKFFLQNKKFFFCCVLGDRYYCSSGSISKKNNQ